MKSVVSDFEYFVPKTVEEALKLLSQYEEEECKVIAGGQSLIILMKQRLLTPKYLIDIKGLSDLDYIKNWSPNHSSSYREITCYPKRVQRII